jgi:hypothetical protein
VRPAGVPLKLTNEEHLELPEHSPRGSRELAWPRSVSMLGRRNRKVDGAADRETQCRPTNDVKGEMSPHVHPREGHEA